MDVTSVDELLTTTRAVRKRLDLTRPVGRDVMLECVRPVMQAPTASRAQELRRLVIIDAPRGLGSVWTTMHFVQGRQAAESRGIRETVTQPAVFAVAYTIGTDFEPATRPAAETITFWNSWAER